VFVVGGDDETFDPRYRGRVERFGILNIHAAVAGPIQVIR
jgi:hypothetical protein